jgi:uncharacterized protein
VKGDSVGFKRLELKMPTSFSNEELKKRIAKKLRLKEFTFHIEKQSLDARRKSNIHWNIRVAVSSPALPPPESETREELFFPYKKRDASVVVVGSGPAGYFAGYALLLAGFNVTLLEQGPEVNIRFKDIVTFERSGNLNERSNYAFGEGGAGTFSDGKLTSRTKSISKERNFIFDTYIQAGAPKEIAWLSHPHLGSDNLRKIVKNLRYMFKEKKGNILFDTKVINIEIKNETLLSVDTDKGKMEAQYFIFAPGHSSYETYRMLIRAGIPFQVKPFALGTRAEHRQDIINRAQWGKVCLPGVKAAEYRLTFKQPDQLPVYSFCMCPGGKVVPAASYKHLNIVNGMSNYRRNSDFANAAVVAGIDLRNLLERDIEPLEALEWLENLEKKFFDLTSGYAAPACNIKDFLADKTTANFPKTSYPFNLLTANFNELLPEPVVNSLKKGLYHFNQKLKGFEEGLLLGLESKTSSPIQALRHKTGQSLAIKNLYLSGEGAGYSGGIISSAADGIKAAIDIIYR